jgi:hypothetical protein
MKTSKSSLRLPKDFEAETGRIRIFNSETLLPSEDLINGHTTFEG